MINSYTNSLNISFMSTLLKLALPVIGILLFLPQQSDAQQREVLDKIVAVVNDQIILKSDVDAQIAEFLSQRSDITYSDEMWYDVLENIIDNNVLYEQAKIDSITVSEDEVNRALDRRIRQLVQQVGSEEALEEVLGQSLIQVRSEFRDRFRRDIMVQRVRDQKMRSIRITRPEVVEFFNNIPQHELPEIPETVELSHIVAIAPAGEEAEQMARQKAEALRDSLLNHDADFEELARRHSDGPGASRGGLLPMMPLSDLVSEYAAAASALEPGGISEVVRTRAGFHVIRLNRRSGDQIETSQILIQVQEDQVDESIAIEKLEALRDSVITHGERFSDLARRHSQDPNTAPTGGRLIDNQTGQRRLAVDDLDPTLYRAIINLEEEGDITEPIRYTIGSGQNRQIAYRIIRLNSRIPEHIANLDQDFDIIRNFALQEKQLSAMNRWLTELREDIYIEYRIDSPYASTN